jgi:hypothetical protein
LSTQKIIDFIVGQKKNLLRILMILSVLGALFFLRYLLLYKDTSPSIQLSWIAGLVFTIWILSLSLQILLKEEFQLDKIFILGFSILVYLFFFNKGSGPVTYDDLLYLHSGLNLTPDATILWRYTHVYLIKFAIWIFHGDPFLAEKAIWAIYIALSVPVIYFSSKHLVKDIDKVTSIIIGFSSICLFFCLPFLDNAGLAFPDIAVMFFIGLGVWIYIEYLRNPKFENWLLPLFGFICWIGLNAKELAIVLVVLLPGIINVSCVGKNSFRSVIWRLSKIAGGTLISILLFIVLDTIFLKQPFFHWQFENWKIWLGFNENQNNSWSQWNYLSYLSSTSLLPMFSLAFFNLIWLRRRNKVDFPTSLIWMILPIVLIINTLIKFQVYDRYTIPLYLPLVTLAGQGWLLIEDFNKIKVKIISITMGTLTVFYFGLSKFIIPYLVKKAGNLDDAFSGIYLPFIFFEFMILIIWIKRPAFFRKYIIIIFMGLSIVASFYININAWKNQTSLERKNKHFAALMVFNHDLAVSNNSLILISPSLSEKYSMFYPTIKPTTWMINVYFRTNLQTDQIKINIPNGQNISKANYDYIFLSSDDWNNLETNLPNEILDHYSLNIKKKAVLLIKK